MLALLMIIGVIYSHAQTPSLGDYQSVNSGNWSDLINWERFNGSTWVTPTLADGYPGQNSGTGNVTIQDGHTITIDVSPAQLIEGLYVGEGTSGILQFDAEVARILRVSGIVTINHNAIFRSALTGIITTHQLIVETGIVNHGTLDFSTGTAGAGITFSGNSNGLFDLSNATLTNLMASNGLVLDKGTGVLSFTPGGTLQVRSGNAEGFLTIQSGTFCLMGQNAFSNPLFSASNGSYTIPLGGGFQLNNPHATIVGMYGTLTNNGEIIIRDGVYNIGTGTGNESLTLSTGKFEMSGGTMNISGRFRIDGGNCIINGGVLNLATIGHANRTLAAFHISEAASLSISGNPLITLAFPNSNTIPYNDIEIVAGSGIKTISGGTFQLGTSSTPSTRPFLVNSDIPFYNLVVFSANTRVELTDHLTINNQLTLNGRLLMNIYNLTLGAPDIAGDMRANHGMILTGTGQIQKTINTPGSYLFPFGNSSDAYLPVTLNFTGGSFTSGATVSVGMTPSKHSQNTNTTNFLRRFWTVSTSGIVNPVYNFTGTYASTDVAGNDAYITTGVYTTTWRKLSAANNIGTTIYASGLTENADITGITAAAPAVMVTASPATVCSGSPVQLTTTVTGDIPFTYSWTPAESLTNPTISNPLANPNSTTPTTITYTVSVTDGMGGVATGNATVTVNPLPTATLSGTKDVCQDATSPILAFTGNSGTAPYTFTYRMNGGANQTVTSTGNSATVAVPTDAPGEFIYTLVSVQDANNCQQPQTGTATVTVYPLPTVTVGSNSPQCVGGTLNLNASGGELYSWTGPNSFTSTQQNPSIANVTTAAAGLYTVSVTDANGCVATASTSVTINPAPSVSITASPGNTICSGENVTFTTRVTNAGTNPSYQWRIDNVPISGANSSTFSTTTMANSQQVTVVVTADPAYCSSSATSNIITMTVNPPVVPSVTIRESQNNICAGTTVNFSTIVTNGGTSPTYQWQVNGADIPGANSSTYSRSTLNNGDQVRVIITSNAPCASPSTATSSAITMVVNPLVTPSVSIAANPSTAICPGTAITFTATPVNGGSNPIYQWQVNGTNVGTNSPIFTSSTLANGDAVSVRMTSNASCLSAAIASSDVFNVLVNPGAPAIPAPITGNTVVCPNGSATYTIAQVANATSYTWTVPSDWQITSGQGSNSINVTTGNTGQNRSITVTASNSCGVSGARTLAVSVGSLSVAPTGITISNNNTCSGTPKVLTVTGGSLGTGATWQWFTGACGETLLGSGPSITVNPASGTSTTYYVRATGTCNTTLCANGTVIVSPGAPAQPQAITGGANPVCPGVSLTYSIAAVADASSYSWTVPPGWTITAGQGTTSITVTSGAAGQDGDISVMAVNSCGSGIARTLAVTVAPGIPAIPGPITGNSDQCINRTGLVYSIASVPNATAYTWSFPSGWTITSGQGTNSITVSTNGTASSGNISVVASNACGISGASSSPVNVVTDVPSTPGAITGLTAICPVKSVVYSIVPVPGAIGYTWTVPTNWSISSGQGTSSVTVQVPSNAASGNITVVAYNICGNSTASTLAVTVANTAWVNAGIDQVVCLGTQTITLNGSVGGAIKANQTNEWDWIALTGTINNQNSLSSTYTLPNNGNTPGVYTVRIKSNVNAVGCTQTEDEMTITVLPNPNAVIAVTGNNPICNGSASTITFTATPNTTVTYRVYGGASQTIAIGTSGTSVLNTAVLTSSTTYSLVSVAYTATPICSQTVTGSATITVDPVATVSAGSYQTICAGTSATMAGSLGGSATSGTWTSSGTGSFSNNTPTAVYTPSAADILAGTVTLTYTTDDPSGPCGPVSDAMVLTINPQATVSAGSDRTICAGMTATMAGTFGGSATSGTWTSGGTGSFSNNTPTAVYTPSAGDILAGTVTLTYTTDDPSGPCGPASDAMVLTINPVATVNAGEDQSVCATSTVSLTGMISGPVSSGTWSGGTGMFSNPTTLNTVYTPSAEEMADGRVILILSSDDPDGPCGIVSDQVTITINPSATVNAGEDQLICEGSAVILRGTIGGAATSASWSGGRGSFSNPASPNTTYTPAAGETGDIILTLITNDPSGTCNPVNDALTVTINPAATVNAGPDQTICSNGTATMAGTFGGSATSGTWSTSGGGSFSDPSAPTAIYTPANSDIFNGSVILTYTTNDPEGPCTPVSAFMTLTINDAIQITSQPVNIGVCATYPADLSVRAVGDTPSYQWYRGTAPGGTAVANSTNITGAQSATLHFNHATSVDEGSYYVVISGAADCDEVTSNAVTLNVDQEITITTPLRANSVCVGEDVTFNIVAEPGGLLTFQWRKDGVNLDGATGNTLTLNDVTLVNAGSYDVLIAGLAGYTCSNAVSAAAFLTVNDDATIALSSATETDDQKPCLNTLIEPIIYTIGGGGTGATITAGSLPDGVTGVYDASTKTFTISGIPTEQGSFDYTITATGLCEDASLSGTITVRPNSSITLSSATATTDQTVCIDDPIENITYAIGGSAIEATVTGLPEGVNGSFNAGVFTISGTPTVANTFNYTVTTNGPCENTSLNGSITVRPHSTISLSSAAATTTQTICIDDPIATITYAIGGSATGATVTGLPSGVNGSFNAGMFTISGTPTIADSFNYTVTTLGPCVNNSLSGTIVVNDNSTITLSSAAATTAQTVCIDDPITTITYAIGGSATGATVTGLPTGVNGSYNDGIVTINGTPTIAGSYPFTVTTTGSSCINPSSSGTLTVSSNGTISLTSGNPNQSVCINTPMSNIVYAVGGSATGVTADNLPPGVRGTYNAGVYVLSGIPTTANIYNFTLTTTGTCASGSITGTITVDPASVGGTLSPYNSTVCTTTNSGSLSLDGETGTILRWESSTNAGGSWSEISNASNTYNFSNLPLTTIFRAVVKSGACEVAYSAPARVVVIPLFEPIITATTVDVCNGNSTTLSVQTGLLQPVGAFTGGGFNEANPAGWRVSQNGSVISPFPAAGDNRAVGPWAETNGPRTFNGVSYDTQDNTKFTIVNGAINSTLETPVFNLFGLPSAELTFRETHNLAPGATARVELSTDGGNSYNIVLATYTGSTGGIINNPVDIDMSPYLGMMNLRIRFNYISTAPGGWALDGVSIPSQQTDVTYTWSPAETLSSTTDSVVIATPGVTTEYTLTMRISGCPVIAKSIVIGVANPPTVQTTNACVGGGPVTFTQTGGTLGGTWRVTGGGNIDAATGVFTPASPGCFYASYITPAGTCGDTVSFVVFPAAPTPIVNAGCGPIVITPPATVPGFTLQYSFDNGTTWEGNTPPTAENCTGYQIRTRYITTAVCETIPANTASEIAGCAVSPAVTRVVDLSAPVITCPENITASTNLDACYATLTLTPPVVSDNCSTAQAITVTNNAPSQFPVGETIVTWTAVDACGNQSTCTQIITITDNGQAPVFTSCPDDQEQTALPNNCALYDIVLTEPVAADNCAVTRLTYTTMGATTLTSPQEGMNYVSGQDLNVGETTITYTAYDAAGNASAPCTFKVWIKDLNKPVFTVGCPPPVIQDADPDLCTAEVTVPIPDVTDPCNEGYTLTNDYTHTDDASGTYPVGTTTVTWTVTDVSGNIETCVQTITINDRLPILTCPSIVAEEIAADGCSKSDVTIDRPSFVGNCANPVLSYALSGATEGSGIGYVPDDQIFNVGITTVAYTVTDSHNNTTSCQFTVTIRRLNIPPAVIVCPESPVPVTAVAGTCFADVTVASPVEIDPCETATYTFINDHTQTDNASGSYRVGTTIVTWTITDNSGNTTTCQQTVIVNDLPPTITCPVPVVVQADFEQPYQDAVTVAVPIYSDNCPNAALSWTLVPPAAYAAEYEPGELSGTGPYPSPSLFYLGVSTITYTVTDANGNTVTCSFTVSVLTEPEITCLPGVPYNTDDGQCTATRNSNAFGLPTLVRGLQPVTWTWIITNPDGSQGASDTFTGSTATPGPPAITDYAFQQGISTITWRAENVSGFDECTQTVTVTDNQAPTFTVPSAITRCVESILWAVYNPNPTVGIVPEYDDITTPRPEYFLFTSGSTLLDLDAEAASFNDNCCADEELTIHWRIDFASTPNPASAAHEMITQPPITGEGQPSLYDQDIHFPGDGVNFQDIIHQITYWLVDCNGIPSPEQHAQFIIQPRPNITKVTD